CTSRSSRGTRRLGREDPIVDAAVVEMMRLRFAPAAERGIDRDHPALREPVRVLRRDALIARPEVVARDDVLPFRRVQELEVGLCNSTRAASIDARVAERDGRFGENADGWRDDLGLVATELLDREQRLVLPGQ